MKLMRASVTEIEAYRRYRDEPSDNDPFDELDTLLAQLSGKSEPNEAMLMGRAFHKFLEDCHHGDFAAIDSEGFIFQFAEEMAVALPRIREMKCTHLHRVDDVMLTVSGIVDAVDALTVYDHKLTGNARIEKYADSYQWRIYLWMLGLRRFIYNVFSRWPPENNVVTIHKCDILTLYNYPCLASDVEALLRDYVAFTKRYQSERIT